MKENLYDVLGIDKNATEKEVKEAYRREAKKNHEDKGGDKDKMILVNKAWAVLGDAGNREFYDRTGNEEKTGFDVRFGGYVQDLFMGLVESERNVERVDLVKEFLGQTNIQITNMKKGRKIIERRRKKMGIVLERLGDGRIKEVVRRNMDGLVIELGSIDENIKFLEECAEVIGHEYYRVDLEPEVDKERDVWVESMLKGWQQAR